jgi:hypothetical protein
MRELSPRAEATAARAESVVVLLKAELRAVRTTCASHARCAQSTARVREPLYEPASRRRERASVRRLATAATRALAARALVAAAGGLR